MQNLRKPIHSVHQLQVHIVWSTKYRFQVLKGEIQIRCRDLIRQSCDRMDVQLLKGVVSKDHVHLHLSYAPKLSISEIVKPLKGRSARILLEEFGELRKRYWGGHFWGIGYGAWSSGNITDEIIQAYLEHHKEDPNGDESFILE
ncbi:IS200/IS605 family transposase [Rhodocytophaga rosea]|uniref:IS200/IS605 family transposase n=1 Tax=Rhodocytophaga rosea TaxID=2704465 RepID=A0A6C0GU59_9BACT|nr:IS200/IS605 family transposase [Rhodocytophaga rosea]QHT71731.1 IS200/IS605 family transposase [Rhodocytophaga rosea]